MKKAYDDYITKVTRDLEPWEVDEAKASMEDAISNCSTVIFHELGN